MFNPDLTNVLKNHLSRYSLVTATAKRAREIAEDAEENNVIITEKPVS
ncbi:MAG: DNA-directed RNA polymerase subunit omega, partial [Clostridia bacterium]|nr:DNA-directed RNA polymerase subunit omega [Clostridia bacterium]